MHVKYRSNIIHDNKYIETEDQSRDFNLPIKKCDPPLRNPPITDTQLNSTQGLSALYSSQRDF
jgi:hypothetical protein